MIPEPNFILVVQMPTETNAQEFLAANVQLSKFDQKLWASGKSDKLIVELVEMRSMAIGHFPSALELKKKLRVYKTEYVVTNGVKTIAIDFAFPSRDVVIEATKRVELDVHAQKVARLKQEVLLNQKYQASIGTALQSYRTFLEQPNILSGIRSHYEKNLIRDKIEELLQARRDNRSLQKKLRRAERVFIAYKANLSKAA